MKRAICLLSFLGSRVRYATSSTVETEEQLPNTSDNSKDDAQFWSRFLNELNVVDKVAPWQKKMSLTDAPTKSPVEQPTKPPTKPPNPGTAPPTKPPTQPPTQSPTQPPTTPPTASPSASPSSSPTSAPSVSPSSSPVGGPCNVNVTVICEDRNEVPCNEIPSPSSICFAVGNEAIEVLSFTYLPGNDCSMSRNQQYEESKCEDLDTLVDGPVNLACVDGSGSPMVVTEQNITVAGKSLFTLTPEGGGSFPNNITCTVIDENTLQPMQRVTINTSGDVELNLKEAFGALQLESCDDLVCIQEVFFTNFIDNIGSNDMEVTLVNITTDEDSYNLAYLVDPNPLPQGEQFVLIDVRYIDYCETGNVTYYVEVDANPESMEMCMDEDKYIFPINPSCGIMLNLTCVEVGTGLACADIPPITIGDGESCVSEVMLDTCAINQGTIDLFLTEFTVGIEGQSFTNLLDETIVLQPGEAFCAEGMAEIYKCNETTYTVVSTVVANDTSAIGCKDEEKLEFHIGINTLQPSASPSARPTALPTASPSAGPTFPPSEAPFSAAPSAAPTASPTSALSAFPTMNPSSPPTGVACNVSVTVECVDQNDQPCDEITPPSSTCFAVGNEAIEVLSFSYLPGNDCSMSRNQQYENSTCQDLSTLVDGPVNLDCVDGSGNPMMVVEESTVGGFPGADNITDATPESLFTVRPEGGGSFPGNITCTIINESTLEPMQRVTINTSGDVELNLKEAFGALQLESCDDQVCIQKVFFTNFLDNVGTNLMEVTVLNITIPGEYSEDLTYLVAPNPLAPGDRFQLIDVHWVDFCETGNFSYCVDADADSESLKMCQDQDKVVLEIEPSCGIMLNLTCVEVGTGLPCSDIPPVTIGEDDTICFSEVELDTCAINQGTIDLFLTEFTIGIQGQSITNLLPETIVLQPGEAYCAEGTADIYKCNETAYTVVSTVVANDTSNIGCTDEELLSFIVGTQTLEPSASPSGTPTALPSSLPTASPTSPPSESSVSESPTSSPTAAPSPPPTQTPLSEKPSASPTLSPSPPPSIEPVEEPSASPTLLPSPPPSIEPVEEPSASPTLSPSPPPSIEPVEEPSASPTLSPSPPPSSEPIDEPSASPTVSPTSAPSEFPVSEPPTSNPTVTPPTELPLSELPTSTPTASPSQVPPDSEPPTFAPSGDTEPCSVSVSLICEVVTDASLDCADLEPPSRARCTNGQRLDSVAFSYLGAENSACEFSRNQQGEEARCKDERPLLDTAVDIACYDLIFTPLTVEPTTVMPGEYFTVTDDTSGNPLVQKINCTISSNGNVLQWNVIDVSGVFELDLKEQYGALVLESCDGITCVQTLEFRSIVDNIGATPMNVTLADETVNGITTTILGNLTPGSDGALDPAYVLEPNQQAFFERTNMIVDLCQAGEFNYTIDVEANPPGGIECEATETFIIPITAECVVGTTLTCTHVQTGLDCDSIPKIASPECDCGETCVTELYYRYSATTCEESAIDSSLAVVECRQFQDVMPTNPVITVVSGSVQYFSGTVDQTTNIVVSAGGGACLSEEFKVLIQTTLGSPVQEFTLSPGCSNDDDPSMALTNSYVSFDFTGYTCQDALQINCYGEISLEQCGNNDGFVDLTLTSLDLSVDGTTTNLLDDPSISPILQPGEGICAAPVEYEIYLCEASSFTFSGTVTANDIAGGPCFGSETNSFDILQPETFPPTSFPTGLPSPSPSEYPTVVPSIAPSQSCDLTIETTCTGCQFNTTQLPLCLERPTLIGMLFRGGDCSENNFSQPLDRVACYDFPQNGEVPALGSGGTVWIRANADPKDTDPGGTGGDSQTLLFEGVVSEGSVWYMYDGGGRLPADTQIRIYPAEGPRDSTTVLQDVRFHASCSQPFLLLNVFGSNQMVMFSNDLQGNVTLFASATADYSISIPVTGIPSGDSILTIVNATIRTNYTTPALSILEPLIGERLCSEALSADPANTCSSSVSVEFETTLNLAEAQGYLQEITILATGDVSGQRCIGRGISEFFAPTNDGWAVDEDSSSGGKSGKSGGKSDKSSDNSTSSKSDKSSSKSSSTASVTSSVTSSSNNVRGL